MAYLAVCDEDGTVGQVIVIPDGLPDPVAFTETLGLTGTFVPTGEEKVGKNDRLSNGEIFPLWRQSYGAGDEPLAVGVNLYPQGSKVFHNGQAWVSTVNDNVWEPGVSGWQPVGSGGPPPWQQPTGAHDAYALGAVVTYSSSTWVSTVSANVWAPGVYGWVIQ